eukprot:511737_1
MATRALFRHLCTVNRTMYHSVRFMTPLSHFQKLSIKQTNAWTLHSKYYISNSDDEFGDIGDIEPLDLNKQRTGKGDNLQYLIIDVREAKELENNYNLGDKINDWIHIPKGQILNISDKEEFSELLSNKGINHLDEYQDLYFLCRSGMRSMACAQHVNQLDVDQTLFNITGGIIKYDKDIGLN